MNWQGIWTIARKDLLLVRRSPPMFYPLVVLSTLILLVLPLIVTVLASSESAAESVMRQWDVLSRNIPDGVTALSIDVGTEQQRLVILGNVYLLAPFYLLVPLLVATVIAADTFAGEKERRTLEALLYAPLTDREILAGKLLAAWLPAILVGVGGFLVYTVVLNLTAWPIFGTIFFPTSMWLLLVFWLGPAISGLGLGTMVLVSARVRSMQEATQLGGGIVLPVILLIAGQMTGVLYFSNLLVLVLGGVIWLVNIVLLARVMSRFQRERLLLSDK